MMLFMKCTEKKCVPDCGKCNKCKKAITYHFVESLGKFSDPD